jgi:hypothetical protein
MIEQFREIARLIGEVGPKLDAADRYGDDSVMIETEPLIVQGKMAARIWGPFQNEEEAHNFINIKRDRHRLSNARHHGEEGGSIENDKHFMGHPQFRYRVVSSSGYFAKYLAQVMMTCCTALVGAATVGEASIPFAPPSDDYGITDDDEGLETEE